MGFLRRFMGSPRRVFAASGLVLLCSVLLSFAINVRSLPNYINVSRDGDNEITAFLPFSLTLSGNEAVTASSSDDERVAGDGYEIIIQGETYGAADLDGLSLRLFGMPVKRIGLGVLPTDIVPYGRTVGVRINTLGIMVLSTGGVDAKSGIVRPSDGKLRAGDVIVAVQGKKVDNKTDFIKEIEGCGGADVNITVKRGDAQTTVTVSPALTADGVYKIGAWIRDGTQGIGTVTYFDPKTRAFGALGHGILDVDTKKLMSVRKGEIMESRIISVKRGKKGFPGELEGDVNADGVLGTISVNTPVGLYGYFNAQVGGSSVPVAHKSEIHEGPAKIRSNISGSDIREYDIFIESVNIYGSDDGKGMVVRITDADLLAKTNGIVQGMSGSPIIQDGKIAGAVTHVFVQNPTRGYGIFIENMLKAFP